MGKWTPEIEQVLLARLLDGEALNAICNDPSITVSESYVRKMANEDAEFGAKYAHARDIGYDCRAERAVENTKTDEAAENPQIARLQFDAERWYLGKMKPKVYGDKQLVGSDPDNPLPSGVTVTFRNATGAEDA